MKISDFQKVAELCIQADVPLRGWGKGGIGKSQSIQQLAKKLGFFFEDLRLANHEVGDLIGLPYLDESGDVAVTKWGRPGWLDAMWSRHHAGIPTLLCVEEKGRAPKEVTQAFFQVLTDRCIHDHNLPPSVRIIALDNPPTEEYQVAVPDRAECTRFCNVHVTPNADDWLDNYASTHVSPELAIFIAGNKEALSSKDKKTWNVETLIYNEPRTWVLVDRLWNVVRDEFTPEDELLRTLLIISFAGCVGSGPATLYVDSLISDWISKEDLLTGVKTYEDVKGKPEIRIRAFHQFLHFLSDEDLLTEDGKMDKKRIERFGEFVMGLDQEGYRDLAVSLLKKFLSKRTSTGKSSQIVKMLFKYGPKGVTKMIIDTGNSIASSDEDY